MSVPVPDMLQDEHDETSGAKRVILMDEDGNGISTPDHNYIAVTYPSDTTELYTFKTGGASGTTVQTITLVYTNSTKDNLSTVTKA